MGEDGNNQHRWKVTGHQIAHAVKIAAEMARNSSDNPRYVAALEAAASLLKKAEWPAARHVSHRWAVVIRPSATRRVKGKSND
jgi:hypothetical protein